MCILQASVYTAAKLSIIISINSTASTYNQNIDKRLAQLFHEIFSYKTFVYQKILFFYEMFVLWNFGAIQYFGYPTVT